jgi:uroporphyrinogen-III synthase
LRNLSTQVWTVTPYRWVQPSAHDRLPRLIEATCARQLDALTFTSAPGAEATLAVAGELGRLSEFVTALGDDVVAAAVGPVTAGPLLDAGARVVMPDRYRLGALIRLVTEELTEHRVVQLRSGDVELELRGRAVILDGRPVMLGPSSLALFKVLAGTEAVVRRPELQRCLPDGADDHALEVAMSRLRQSLGVPGLVTTVVKRGYRLNAVRV